MSDDNSFQELRSASDQSYEKLAEKMSHIKGWAIDANSKNDPTFPIRQRFNGDGQAFEWERPVQQKNVAGILQSNERKQLPGVFGTTAPATGMSGCLRRYAFRFAKGSIGIGCYYCLPIALICLRVWRRIWRRVQFPIVWMNEDLMHNGNTTRVALLPRLQ